MRYSDLKSLDMEELFKKREELKEECLRLRCNHAIKQLQDVQMIKKRKRDIARVSTEINVKMKIFSYS